MNYKLLQKPDKNFQKQPGFDSDMKVELFQKNEFVPETDPDYKFNKDTTLDIAGFSFNKRGDTRIPWNQVYSYRTSCS